MSIGLIDSLAQKRVLLLQGPMGPFFKKLDRYLRDKGALTFRICFNGGDRFFSYKDNSFNYVDKTSKWKSYITRFLHSKDIDAIILYGDCRIYHRIAKAVALQMGVQILVFEEGYVRPNFITMEDSGVNADSRLPRECDFYRQVNFDSEDSGYVRPVKYSFQKWMLYTIIYFLFMKFWQHRFPENEHHRNTNIGFEVVYGIRNLILKIWFAVTEKKMLKTITNGLAKKYYFVPLQVQYDFQISRHSQFSSMEEFIGSVMVSFAKDAPGNTHLVYKHHPMDRGRRLFYGYIRSLARQLGVSDRVHVLHDVHLPTCLKNAIGTITINSTVGISSLYHGIPTIVLGEALYDIKGLTCKGLPLGRFWSEYKVPDQKLFRVFRGYLIKKTQLRGSFYGGWPEQLR